MLKCVVKAKLVEVNARALLSDADPVPEPVLESDDPKKNKNKKQPGEANAGWSQPLPAPGSEYAPPLLHSDSRFSGFLALLLVTPSQINFMLNRLLSEADYEEVLRQRAANNGELVTFRLCDLRGPVGTPYNNIYEANLTNKGKTWGKGVYECPEDMRDEIPCDSQVVKMDNVFKTEVASNETI
jgi:hypothetical protein